MAHIYTPQENQLMFHPAKKNLLILYTVEKTSDFGILFTRFGRVRQGVSWQRGVNYQSNATVIDLHKKHTANSSHKAAWWRSAHSALLKSSQGVWNNFCSMYGPSLEPPVREETESLDTVRWSAFVGRSCLPGELPLSRPLARADRREPYFLDTCFSVFNIVEGSLRAFGGGLSNYSRIFTSNALKIMSGDPLGPIYGHLIYLSNVHSTGTYIFRTWPILDLFVWHFSYFRLTFVELHLFWTYIFRTSLCWTYICRTSLMLNLHLSNLI